VQRTPSDTIAIATVAKWQAKPKTSLDKLGPFRCEDSVRVAFTIDRLLPGAVVLMLEWEQLD
jgi:hypothetical protein